MVGGFDFNVGVEDLATAVANPEVLFVRNGHGGFSLRRECKASLSRWCASPLPAMRTVYAQGRILNRAASNRSTLQSQNSRGISRAALGPPDPASPLP
jgi:hypothetical protein